MSGIWITINTAESHAHITRLHDSRRNKGNNATLEDDQFSALTEHILCSWPSTKTEVQKELKPYWLFSDAIAAIIDEIVKKGRRRIMILALQQEKVKNELHSSHIGIEKNPGMLAYELIYWLNMTADMKK